MKRTLYFKINKTIKRVKQHLFGPTVFEKLELIRKNREYRKNLKNKRNEAMMSLLYKCSKLK